MRKVTRKLILPSVNREPMGICCVAQESQTGLGINLEGWGGEGDGREVQKAGDTCTPVAD